MRLFHCSNPECGHAVLQRKQGMCGRCGFPLSSLADDTRDVAAVPWSDPAAEAVVHAAAWQKRLANKGRVIAFVGPTGAGKSSFLNQLLGWPALQKGFSSHTTRVPALIRHGRGTGLAFWKDGIREREFSTAIDPHAISPPPPERRHGVSPGELGKKLRASFWAPIQDGEEWHSVDANAWVAVSTDLSWLDDGACLVDTPGFDGLGEAGSFERELADSVRFWCAKADAVVFIFDQFGMKMSGHAELLRECAARGKPTAVFFNKMDKVKDEDIAPDAESDADLLRAAQRHEDERLSILENLGVRSPVYFGYCVEPRWEDVLTRHWRTGIDDVFLWLREQAKARNGRNGKNATAALQERFSALTAVSRKRNAVIADSLRQSLDELCRHAPGGFFLKKPCPPARHFGKVVTDCINGVMAKFGNECNSAMPAKFARKFLEDRKGHQLWQTGFLSLVPEPEYAHLYMLEQACKKLGIPCDGSWVGFFTRSLGYGGAKGSGGPVRDVAAQVDIALFNAMRESLGTNPGNSYFEGLHSALGPHLRSFCPSVTESWIANKMRGGGKPVNCDKAWRGFSRQYFNQTTENITRVAQDAVDRDKSRRAEMHVISACAKKCRDLAEQLRLAHERDRDELTLLWRRCRQNVPGKK